MIKKITKKILKHKNTSSLELVKKILRKISDDKPKENKYLPTLKNEFKGLQFGSYGIQKLLDEYNFSKILDIGCGAGHHSDIFIKYKKKVTGIDYGDSVYFKKNKSRLTTIIADFNEYSFEEKFDAIWCCHVLEHQLNINKFLKKIFNLINNGGVLAITVPPRDDLIMGGHVSMWNAGLLLYNLVLAGFNCKNANILQYGYNITIIVKKNSDSPVNLENLSYDYGDLRKIKRYFPDLNFLTNDGDDPFMGNIYSLNW